MTPVFLTDRGERLLRHLVAEETAHRTPSGADIERALSFGKGNVLHVQTEVVRAGCAYWTFILIGGRQHKRTRVTERGFAAVAGKVPIERKRNTMWRAVP